MLGKTVVLLENDDLIFSRMRFDVTNDGGGLAGGREHLRAFSASAASSASTMPMPQLKVRYISKSSTPPISCSQSKIAGRFHARASITARTPSGSTRGTLPGSPPPVMCAAACTGNSRSSASSGLT